MPGWLGKNRQIQLESDLKTSFFSDFIYSFNALAEKIRAQAATFYIAITKSDW
jgi:hypothetical protein